jgi:hypothetical protein
LAFSSTKQRNPRSYFHAVRTKGRLFSRSYRSRMRTNLVLVREWWKRAVLGRTLALAWGRGAGHGARDEGWTVRVEGKPVLQTRLRVVAVLGDPKRRGGGAGQTGVVRARRARAIVSRLWATVEHQQ